MMTSGIHGLLSDVPLTYLIDGVGGISASLGPVSVQVAFAAMRKLKTALNFRQWTARGKGLVLLNVLVSTFSSIFHHT